ncbi:MAG: DUF1801 domain-containing protein [Pyrinomonadaceae bacterium]
MKNSPPKELIKFLQPYDPEIRKLALNLRSLVLEEMGPCHENIYDAYSAVAIGYGPTGRLNDGICHIAVYTKHVNLGFNHGATLADPEGILQGAGKRIRHITIKTPADLARRELRSYLRRARAVAIEDARKLGESPSMEPKSVVSVVKAVYRKKRRPGGSAAKKRTLPNRSLQNLKRSTWIQVIAHLQGSSVVLITSAVWFSRVS